MMSWFFIGLGLFLYGVFRKPRCKLVSDRRIGQLAGPCKGLLDKPALPPGVLYLSPFDGTRMRRWQNADGIVQVAVTAECGFCAKGYEHEPACPWRHGLEPVAATHECVSGDSCAVCDDADQS